MIESRIAMNAMLTNLIYKVDKALTERVDGDPSPTGRLESINGYRDLIATLAQAVETVNRAEE